MSFSNQYRALKLSMGSQSYSRSSFNYDPVTLEEIKRDYGD